MISNQILQSTIDGLKVISRIDLSVMDLEGNVLAATYPEAEEHHASHRYGSSSGGISSGDGSREG